SLRTRDASRRRSSSGWIRHRGRWKASLSMFRLRIFHSSVWRGMPSFAAAPRGPATLPCVSWSAASINVFSPSASVVTAVPFDGLRCLRASHDSSITNVSPPPPPTQHDATPDHLLELAHVPRPVVGREPLHGFFLLFAVAFPRLLC